MKESNPMRTCKSRTPISLTAAFTLAALGIALTGTAALAEAQAPATVTVDVDANTYDMRTQALFDRAVGRYLSGDSSAEELFDEVIRANPGDALAYNNRGNARVARGDFAGAVGDYDQALRLEPGLGFAYFNRANARARLGEYQIALADYNEALRLEPQNARFLSNRARVHWRAGNREAALADYRLAAQWFKQQGNLDACRRLERSIAQLQEELRVG
jgi:tetratricopeptide (TPR) repeat protein